MKRPVPRTQLIIFNLYGDYVRHAGGAVWTKGLLEVLGMLGVGQRAARTTLSRMKRRGWLEARRVGRRSLYQATDRAQTLLAEGGQRLFGPRPGPWDGTWTLLTFSLPGERRLTRHLLRTRLSWLGFGSLQPGTLIAAYPRTDEVCRVVFELDAAPYLHIFTGARLDSEEQDRIVLGCWDLQAIDARYASFVERYAPLLRRLRNRQARNGALPPRAKRPASSFTAPSTPWAAGSRPSRASWVRSRSTNLAKRASMPADLGRVVMTAAAQRSKERGTPARFVAATREMRRLGGML